MVARVVPMFLHTVYYALCLLLRQHYYTSTQVAGIANQLVMPNPHVLELRKWQIAKSFFSAIKKNENRQFFGRQLRKPQIAIFV